MDKEFSYLLLRNSLQRNATSALETLKLLNCQAKAILNHDELRENEKLFLYAERIVMTLGPAKNLLEDMSENL